MYSSILSTAAAAVTATTADVAYDGVLIIDMPSVLLLLLLSLMVFNEMMEAGKCLPMIFCGVNMELFNRMQLHHLSCANYDFLWEK